MAGSTLSRRLSEVVGVALFALSLLWLIALVSYSPSDPVWFFNTGSDLAPANFAGRVGAFLAELSFQLVGYAAYLAPVIVAVIGWHYFWCSILDAPYTKAFGAALLFGCTAAFLSAVVRRAGHLRQGIPRRRLHGHGAVERAVRVPESHRLDHPDPDAALPRRSSSRRSSRSAGCSPRSAR